VTYADGELSDLQPAFAITVHRSKAASSRVVIPLVTQHWMMLQRSCSTPR
jgi:ATP-dependent exoDNAse (exonuclease V) alpha subunit